MEIIPCRCLCVPTFACWTIPLRFITYLRRQCTRWLSWFSKCREWVRSCAWVCAFVHACVCPWYECVYAHEYVRVYTRTTVLLHSSELDCQTKLPRHYIIVDINIVSHTIFPGNINIFEVSLSHCTTYKSC